MTDVVPSQNQQSNPEPEEPTATSSESAQAESEPGLLAGAATSRTRRRRKPEKKRSFWKELPILIVTALVLTILIQTFLARVYVIPSESMEMTLIGCDGCTDDRVLVDKLTYDFASVSPGDVIVFKAPDNWDKSEFQAQQSSNPIIRGFENFASAISLYPPNEYDLIKRVVAVGGQTVQCCDNNRVVVDGKPLNEPYIYWRTDYPPTQMTFGPVKVPDGKLWVMGDNRNNSDDSRLQGHGDLLAGAVPVANVIGKARVIVLPPSRWGGVTTVDPQAQASALHAPAWQEGLPAGVGLAAAFPTLWVGRRIRRKMFGLFARGDR
ncbi:MAG TPA: signal peptidase I [Kutzneria sp.]